MSVKVEMKPSATIVNRILNDDVGRFTAETSSQNIHQRTPEHLVNLILQNLGK